MSFSTRRARTIVTISICLIGVLGTLALSLNVFSSAPQPTPTTATAAARVSASPITTPSTARSAVPSASRIAIQPALPGLFGSIGDSIGVAFDAGATFGPEPSHEWTMGTAAGDGIFSILERFRALGDDPLAVDAALAGARMSDAARQARLIVASAAKLQPGSGAFVTLELGGNDACGGTDPAVYEQGLRAAVDVLRELPSGSRILMLSVPDILHLHDLTAGIPAAQEVYAAAHICPAFLSPTATSAGLTAGQQRIVAYNEIVKRVCAEVAATDGAKGRLDCRSDQESPSSMFATQFELADVSHLDYFHPSRSGQAKIADGAWKAGYWAAVPLPAMP